MESLKGPLSASISSRSGGARWFVLCAFLFIVTGSGNAFGSFAKPAGIIALPVAPQVASEASFKLEIGTGILCGNDPVNRHDPLGLSVWGGETILDLNVHYRNIENWSRELTKARFKRSHLLGINPTNWQQKEHRTADIYNLGRTIADLEGNISYARQQIADFDTWDSDANGIIDGVEDDRYGHFANPTTPAFDPISLFSGSFAMRAAFGTAARSAAVNASRLAAPTAAMEESLFPAGYAGAPGAMWRGEKLAGNSPPLYTYSSRSWSGDIFYTGSGQGRLWATEHAPGPWAFESGLGNSLTRAWRTGRWKPFADSRVIGDAAATQFRPVSAFGPFRGWKWAGGQWHTHTPGDLNLITGQFLPATGRQVFLRYSDSAFSYGLDAASWGVITSPLWLPAIMDGE